MDADEDKPARENSLHPLRARADEPRVLPQDDQDRNISKWGEARSEVGNSARSGI